MLQRLLATFLHYNNTNLDTNVNNRYRQPKKVYNIFNCGKHFLPYILRDNCL